METSSQLACLPQCAGCATPHATFRCVDCFAESLFCQECLLLFHHREPFHHLQVSRVYLHSFYTSLTFLSVGLGPISYEHCSTISARSFNSATTMEVSAPYPPLPSPSPYSMSPASTQSLLPTANASRIVQVYHHAFSCFVLGGSPQPGENQALPSHSVSSTSFTNSSQPARSICTISMVQ